MTDPQQRINRWLKRACLVLILVDLLHIPFGLASFPRFYQRVSTLSIPEYGTGIGNALTNVSVLAEAEARGMSVSGFAVYLLVIQVSAALVFTGVGVLVLWRARGHWFGWFTAHVMFFLNSYVFYQPLQVALLVPAYWIDLGAVLWPTVLLYFFLFPNGEVVPRWMRWPIAVYTLSHFLFQTIGLLILGGILPPGRFEAVLPVFQTGILAVFGMVLGAQVYRYARISSSVERAQTRWFILGIAMLAVPPVIGSLLGIRWVFDSLEWGTLSLVLIPVTLAIAILRYRLWDIDVIVRRTLQYTFVTALLAMIYFGGIVLLQGLIGPLVGDRSTPLVTVMTTLGIVGLFKPLRNRVQKFVDLRFYRVKYDAELALAGFASTVRDEVDLDQLISALTEVAQVTMQPRTTSLWVKEPPGRRTPERLGGTSVNIKTVHDR